MLFYTSESPKNKTIKLDPVESKHCIKVLRKCKGETIKVIDGTGKVFYCTIVDDDHRSCLAKVENIITGDDVRNFSLHLAVSPLKNVTRFEWFLEKATETGVGVITPLICKRTEKQNLKTERFKKIVVSAMKQSQRTILPVLNDPVMFDDFIHSLDCDAKYIAWCGDTSKPYLKKLLMPEKSIAVLIGPEGDFTEEEIELALSKRFKPVSLGDQRMRSETAAIAACITFQLINT